ncbi:hypothetical protein EG329_012986 [Mollisiaceae sp. DMI_Dod_QoI]|nr:hypothetical protein EG329_012986 [Helotiales sp. DMI_Dod_QoI]
MVSFPSTEANVEGVHRWLTWWCMVHQVPIPKGALENLDWDGEELQLLTIPRESLRDLIKCGFKYKDAMKISEAIENLRAAGRRGHYVIVTKRGSILGGVICTVAAAGAMAVAVLGLVAVDLKNWDWSIGLYY